MKLRSLLFGLLLCASAASAADVITRTDGTTINAKVEEITETTIRYRKATNTKGPVYAIPLSTVVKIVYDNGDTDTFNTPAETTTQPAAATTSTPPTDEELMRYAETLAPSTPASGAMSDAQLLKYVSKDTAPQIYAKARKYKKIGWIGGGVILATTIIGSSCLDFESDNMAPLMLPIGGSITAVAWTLGFNIRANQLKRQAQEMEFYSSSIIEDEILRFGDKYLTAGVSVMGNHMTRTQGYGLSFKLNF
ncbi:MAG: hypothetical protein K2K49_04475 [Duncaniella sp.]|nr:hypothetical protein [Duncaniella sp.]